MVRNSLPHFSGAAVLVAVRLHHTAELFPTHMTERNATETLIYEALRFAVWAAGEGLYPAEGEPAQAPEEFLFQYSKAMDVDDWDKLPEAIIDTLR